MPQLLTNEKFLKIFDIVEKLHGSAMVDRNEFEKKFGKTLYHSISKEDFELEKQKVLKRLPKLSKNELAFEIYRLFALFKDAHTRLYPSSNFMDDDYVRKFLDLQLIELDNKFYVAGINKENKNLLLQQVEAINDVPINLLVKKAKTMISAETEQYKRINVFSNTNFKNARFLEILGLEDVENGVEITVDGKKYDVSYNTSFVKADLFKIPYFYGFERKDGIAFLGYYIANEDKNYPIKKFCDDLKNNLQHGESVIIDLRNNPGGSSRYFDEIAKVLKEKEVVGCFLTNGGTFSAGTWAAMMCKKLGLVNVGEEWGEPTKRFGDCPNRTKIEELDLVFTVSEKYFDLNEAMDLPSATNKPEIEVHNSIEDLRKNFDRVLQTAISYIKNENHNESLCPNIK